MCVFECICHMCFCLPHECVCVCVCMYLPHVSLFATRVCMCVSKLDKGEGHCVPAASDLVEIPTAGNFYTAIIIMCAPSSH